MHRLKFEDPVRCGSLKRRGTLNTAWTFKKRCTGKGHLLLIYRKRATSCPPLTLSVSMPGVSDVGKCVRFHGASSGFIQVHRGSLKSIDARYIVLISLGLHRHHWIHRVPLCQGQPLIDITGLQKNAESKFSPWQ